MKTLIWDLPLRLFHWALAVLVVMAWVSVEIMEDLDLHFLCGYGILGLILFRLIWGFVGPEHARFSAFVKGPSELLAYLKGEQKNYRGGHNPLGALSVLLMLAVVGLQATTGLFTDDEYYYFGPLNSYVSSDVVGVMSNLHHLNVNVIIAAIALHLAAIAFYRITKKENLVTPMITGVKHDSEGMFSAIPHSKLGLAIVLAMIVTGVVIGIASLEVEVALGY